MAIIYDPSASTVSTEYVVATAGDPAFVCGNNQSYSTSHDNPNNGTLSERAASCSVLSPGSTTVVAGA